MASTHSATDGASNLEVRGEARRHRESARLPNVSNEAIAGLLEQVAGLLEAQDASSYRVSAYRARAQTVRDWPDSVQTLALSGGRAGLDELPHIGPSLSSVIEEIAHTGNLRMLERLRGAGSPVEVFGRIPGIGPRLAKRIHEELGVDTFEELEVAADDGRLARVSGFGPRRVLAVRQALAIILGMPAASGSWPGRRTWLGTQPRVRLLLQVDARYRDEAEHGRLPKIAPRRNNPRARAWLPVLHTDLDGWEFTAMFSNSDRAHALERVRDWVVVYHERDGHAGQHTVVTERGSALHGRRVVRGRERECAALYGKPRHSPASAPRPRGSDGG